MMFLHRTIMRVHTESNQRDLSDWEHDLASNKEIDVRVVDLTVLTHMVCLMAAARYVC